jgi:hypothetical protein
MRLAEKLDWIGLKEPGPITPFTWWFVCAVHGLSTNFTYICHCVSLVSNDNKSYTSLLSCSLQRNVTKTENRGCRQYVARHCVTNWLCVNAAWSQGLRNNDVTQCKDFLTTLDFNLAGRVIAGGHR